MAIHVDVLAIVNKRQVAAEADKIAEQFDDAGADASRKFSDAFVREAAKNSPRVQKAVHAQLKAAEDLGEVQTRYDKAMKSANLSAEDQIKITNDLNQAKRAEADATRAQGAAVADYAKQNKKAADADIAAWQKRKKAQEDYFNTYAALSKRIEDLKDKERVKSEKDSKINPVQDLAALGSRSIQSVRGLGTIGAIPLAQMAGQAVVSLSTLSQFLLTVPAIAGAAAVGMGTLSLATMGFGDAMDNIKDPKKFTESIAKLAPEAQKTAIAFKELIPLAEGVQKATANSFFNNLGETAKNVAGQYAPIVQSGTTGVAGGMNQAIQGAAGQLLDPTTMANVENFLDNVGASFRALAPAAAPFTNAITGLLSAGSNALPGIAQSITDVANAFNSFITENTADGDLQRWIDEGVHAMGQLADSAWRFVEAFAGLDDGGKTFDSMINALNVTASVLPTIVEAVANTGGGFQTWQDILTVVEPIALSINLLLGDMPGQVAGVSSAFTDMLNPLSMIAGVIEHIHYMVDSIRGFLDPNFVSTFNAENFPSIGDIKKQIDANISAGRDPLQGVKGIVGGPGMSYGPGGYGPGAIRTGQGNWTRPDSSNSGPGAQRERKGAPPIGADGKPVRAPGSQGWDPDYFSADQAKDWLAEQREKFGRDSNGDLKKGGAGGTESESDRRDAFIAGLDPSAYAVDPYAPVPGVGPGGYVSPRQQDILSADHDVKSAARDLEDATKDRLALEADNTATQREIDDAKWKELEQSWKLQEAQQKLAEKQRGTTRDLTKGANDLGAAIDPDLGLGDGLSGFAENITKMIGNIIAAPELARLNAIVQADPIQGGYGLMGINGARNIAAGNSPLLGRPYPGGGSDYYGAAGPGNGTAPGDYGAGGYAGVGTPGGASTYGSGPVGSAKSGTSARSFAHDVMMPFWENMGITAGDHAADQYNEHQNGALDLMVGSIDQGKEVLKQVLSDPNVYGAIFNNQVYGYGQGSQPRDYSAGHTGDANQDHTNHVHALYRPNGTDNITPRTVTPGGMAGQTASTTRITGGTPNLLPLPLGSGGGGESPMFFAPQSPPPTPGLPFTPGIPGVGPTGAQPGSLGGFPTPPGVGFAGTMANRGPGFSGAGMPSPAQAAMDTTHYGGVTPGGGSVMGGNGGVGMTPGGTLDTAVSMAASGLDVIAPGAGQAAQTGIKLANRAIQYAGQLAGIGVSGLMETFLPTGGSALAAGGWLPRIVGAVAGAKPALPNVAGGKGAGDAAAPPLTPDQVGNNHGASGGAAPGPVNVNYSAYGQTEDRNGADLAYHLGKGYGG